MIRVTGYNLPEPECRHGYTYPQIVGILGDDLEQFEKWMYGQTMMVCSGRSYNQQPKCEVSHGGIAYTDDLRRYLLGLPIID